MHGSRKEICRSCMEENGFHWNDSDEGPSYACPVSEMMWHMIGDIFRKGDFLKEGRIPEKCLKRKDHEEMMEQSES